jgi:hypothetical protein
VPNAQDAAFADGLEQRCVASLRGGQRGALCGMAGLEHRRLFSHSCERDARAGHSNGTLRRALECATLSTGLYGEPRWIYPSAVADSNTVAEPTTHIRLCRFPTAVFPYF